MNDFGFTFGIKISTFKFHSSFLKFKFPNQISILILWTRKIVFCFSNRRFDFHFLAHRIHAIITSIARWSISKHNLTVKQNNKQSRFNLAKNCFGASIYPLSQSVANWPWFVDCLCRFYTHLALAACTSIYRVSRCLPLPLLNASIAWLYVLVKHKFYLGQTLCGYKPKDKPCRQAS